MESEHESSKRKMDSQPVRVVQSTSKWERKRSAVNVDGKAAKGIQWDEETIAEHDKERGTRQKIDEAPTPYHYYTYDGDSDYQENVDFSTIPNLTSNNRIEKTELLQEVDYNSDYEYPRNDIENEIICNYNEHDIDDSKNHHNNSNNGNNNKDYLNNKKKILHNNQYSATQNGRAVVAQNTSASVFDNWESLQAKLNYEKQLQESNTGTNSLIIANSDNVQRNNFSSVRSNNSSSSSSRSCNMKLCTDDIHNHIISNDNNDKVQDNPFIQKENQGNDCSSVSNSSKLSSKHFQFSPERDNISNIIIDNKDDGNEKKIVLDRVEDDVFKNKRAAHYNEFKLVQAMRARQKVEEDDEDDDEN